MQNPHRIRLEVRQHFVCAARGNSDDHHHQGSYTMSTLWIHENASITSSCNANLSTGIGYEMKSVGLLQKLIYTTLFFLVTFTICRVLEKRPCCYYVVWVLEWTIMMLLEEEEEEGVSYYYLSEIFEGKSEGNTFLFAFLLCRTTPPSIFFFLCFHYYYSRLLWGGGGSKMAKAKRMEEDHGRRAE